ncbi:MAG TPA: hypothetical protein VE870_07540 [Bacteroidales bacterium]|nr:hypothetical protein [Bacteroidales bacterium]
MKTSKIIFISLLGTISAFIVAGAIDVRLNGQSSRIIENKNSHITLPLFSNIIIENSGNLNVIQSDSAYLEVNWQKDAEERDIDHILSGDTLIIIGISKSVEGLLYANLYVSGPINSIILRNSQIVINRINSSVLSIRMNGSKAWLNDKPNGELLYNRLDIRATGESYINTGDFSADSVNVTLQNSMANLNIIAGRLNGVLSEGSTMTSRQADDIQLKKDSTSKILMRY